MSSQLSNVEVFIGPIEIHVSMFEALLGIRSVKPAGEIAGAEIDHIHRDIGDRQVREVGPSH